MGWASTIVNRHDGKKYDVSTAKNPHGVWETAVFAKGFLGLPKLTKPLWVQNVTSESEARAAHQLAEEIVGNSPRHEWERSYSLEGRMRQSQRVLQETSAPEKSYLDQKWPSMFGGKPNTEEVLPEKAKALAPLLLVSGRSMWDFGRGIAKVENDDQLSNVMFETAMFLSHMADRAAFGHLGASKRDVFIERLVGSVAMCLAEGKTDRFRFEALFPDVVDLYNTRQAEYASYRFPSGGQDFGKGDLLWEFGKKIAGMLGADKDVAIIFPVMQYSMTLIGSLGLDALLTGEQSP